ncbi:filamentous hemagglutinin N-terminal domain-containing protein [Propionivibrio sp.]|uniref:two-partner secretion domain-containing protein n=1 Tax=Propionivibrio sp. TaxID=2212460 RepID=UPI003BF12864
MTRLCAFKTKVIAAALAATFAGTSVANPVNPVVASGSAVFQQSGKTLTVTNTPSAIINWQSFNIDRGELTRFIQQSASSQVLNRVTGGDPSKILGSLQSNGRVILINPNGVAFGKGAQVDVAGLLVSTLQLKDADYLAGKLRFTDTPGAGGIKNEGTIKTASGGQVILIAPQIENSGLIHTPEGQILLAAGKSVTIADPDKPSIQVEITNSEQQAINLGTLIGKEISLYGGIVKNSGTIEATTAVVGQNGKISLRAKYEVENTGTLQANGAQGGDILIQAEQGTANVLGVVEARGLATLAEQRANPLAPETGKGGRFEILAPTITADAIVDASGSTGGGAILIGGDYQGGKNPIPADWSQNTAVQRASLSLSNPFAASPSVTETPAANPSPANGDGTGGLGGSSNPALPARSLPSARTVTIGANARLRSEALDKGDGGVIIAWSEGMTTVQGTLSAKGGVNGGNGGLIETSGKDIEFAGARIDASGSRGKNGQWLIDPTNINIDSAYAATIKAALDLGTDTVITTSDGSVTVASAIAKTAGSDATLTFNALTGITLNAAIYSTSNRLNLVLNGGSANNINKAVFLNGGAMTIGTATNINSGSTIGNATLTIANGSGAKYTATGGTLDGVTLNSDLWVKASSLTVRNGLTLNGSTLYLGDGTATGYSYLNWNGTQTIGGNGTILFNTNNGYSARITGNGYAGSTLTLGAQITTRIGSGNGYIEGSGYNLINNGAIVSGVSGKTLYVQPGGTLTNNGTIKATAGGTLTIASGSWVNTGSVQADGGSTLTLAPITWTSSGNLQATADSTLNLGGSFSRGAISTLQHTGGTTRLIGTLDNSGGTLTLNDSMGSFDIASGGTLVGGALAVAAGSTSKYTATGGTLDGVTLNSDFLVKASNSLTVRNGLTLNGSTLNLGDGTTTGSSYLYWNDTQTIGGNGTILFNTIYGYSARITGYGYAGSTLTLGAGITTRIGSSNGYIEGSGYNLINNGAIVSGVSGRTLYVQPGGTLTNNGTK